MPRPVRGCLSNGVRSLLRLGKNINPVRDLSLNGVNNSCGWVSCPARVSNGVNFKKYDLF